jgi:hypothetical protein
MARPARTVGTVDVSHTIHTDAGTYSADYWTFTGTANYKNIAATTIIDTIDKADAVGGGDALLGDLQRQRAHGGR